MKSENCALLNYYTASNGNHVPTIRNNISPHLPLKMGPIRLPETSVSNYHRSLHNDPDERSAHLLERRQPEITKHLQYFESVKQLLGQSL